MKALCLGLFALMLASVSLAESDVVLQVGNAAPDFTLPYATRDSIASDGVKLADLVGKRNVVVAFYPADWSGGCTKEACMLRDNFSSLGAVNAEIVAISGDYVFSHHEWAKSLNLPFRLASDHDHAVAKAYGSYNAASGHDKRTVFVVDRLGKLAYIDMAYSPRDSVSFGKLQSALSTLK
jgi:peroxiredoxin